MHAFEMVVREVSVIRGQSVRSMWETCGYLLRTFGMCSERKGLSVLRCLASMA